MGRRAFLCTVAGLVGVWSLASLVSARAESERTDPWAGRTRWGDLLPNRESAIAIGREYRRVEPGEASLETLARSLRRAVPQLESYERGLVDLRTVRRSLAERVRQDFAAGHTVQLQGWVLSRSEARLCAACSLA